MKGPLTILEQEAVRLRKRLDAGEASEEERRRLIEVFEELEVRLVADAKRRAGGSVLLQEMAAAQLGFLRELERMARGRVADPPLQEVGK